MAGLATAWPRRPARQQSKLRVTSANKIAVVADVSFGSVYQLFLGGCGTECHSHDNVAVDAKRTDEIPRRRGTGLFGREVAIPPSRTLRPADPLSLHSEKIGEEFDCFQKRRVIAQDASQHQRALNLDDCFFGSGTGKSLGHAAFLGDIREGFQPSLKCELQSSCEFFGPTGDR